MSSSWSEIRGLQAALDEVQSSTTSHKLSERNCIEVVSKLVEMGLINVLYTMDGKEYVVTSYLETEIKRELEAHQGRINTVELQTVLNIDLSHIQKAVGNIVNNDPSIELIQGELISGDYKKTLSVQINEQLLQYGNVSLADLSTTFGLPLSYIIPCIESSLGTLINGHLDKSGSGQLYTESYVSRHRAMIRGTFMAVTRPTAIGQVLQRGNYNEHLFHGILHDLVNQGVLAGSIHGGKSDNSLFIPKIYSEVQNQWMDDFLSANGYLEYDAVTRLGVTDPIKYIQKRYKSHNLTMLSSCCLATRIIEEVEGCIEEEVRGREKWVDILPILPSPCTVDDAAMLLKDKYRKDPSLMLFNGVVTHIKFIKHCQNLFSPLVTEKVKKCALSSESFLRQVSQDKDSSCVSDNDGGGRRSGKQKKGKSGRRGGRDTDSEGAQWIVKFMSNTEISQLLTDKMDEIPEDFAIALAEVLSRPLQQLFQEEAKRILEEQSEGEAGALRKRHNVLSQQVQELWNRARLIEKGIQKMDEGDTRLQLIKYLMKTLCTDMTNLIISYVAIDNGIRIPDDPPTLNKERMKITKSLPVPVRQLAMDVHTSLSGKDTEEFFVKFETLCSSDSCGIMLKKLDKKKEKLVLQSHLQTLYASLSGETDPAMTLHLTVVILYQQYHGYPLHTPGKLLPSLVPLLKKGMAPADFKLLCQLQDTLVLQLKQSQTTEIVTDKDSDSKSISLEVKDGQQKTPTDPETTAIKTESVSPESSSPLAGTPSPNGEWEVVNVQSEVIQSGTTKESLELLKEVLDENKEVHSDDQQMSPVQGQEVKGYRGDSSNGTDNVPSGSSTSSVLIDDLATSVKELVLKGKKS